jgi:hypothetical protein
MTMIACVSSQEMLVQAGACEDSYTQTGRKNYERQYC